GRERIHLPDDLLHLVRAEVDAGVQIGEVEQREALEPRRQIRERQGAAGELGQPVRAPDAVRRQRSTGTGIGVRGAGEEAPARNAAGKGSGGGAPARAALGRAGARAGTSRATPAATRTEADRLGA